MCKTRCAKKILILLIGIILVLAYVGTYYSVNTQYPQNTRIIHKSNESFLYNNVTVTVKNTVFVEREEFINNKDIMEALGESSDYPEDVSDLIVVEMEFFNETTDDIQVDLTGLHLESNDFSLQFYYPLMLYYNNSGMYLELKKGERKILKMPVPISKSYFTSSAWSGVRERDYYVVSSLYPEKVMTKVTF